MTDLELLPLLDSPEKLGEYTDEQLLQLADEIREVLCTVVSDRTAHFASNLGVVELAIALHLVFDFRQDRLIWDTGHQVYPHKLLTGRYAEFHTMRQRGGLMGYPNPDESDFDLFMTGHAGASVSSVLGLKTGDDLLGDEDRKAVAVIGDGALPSGIVFEAFNNAAGLNKDVLVILNDNEMGICPRVGGLASTLDKARTAPFYDGLKRDVQAFLNKVPVVGQSVEKCSADSRMPSRASCTVACSSKSSGSATSVPSTATTCSRSEAISTWSKTFAARYCCTCLPKRDTASGQPAKTRSSFTRQRRSSDPMTTR